MKPTLHIVRRVVWKKTDHPRYHYVSTALAIYRYVGIQVPDCEVYHRSRAIGYVKDNHLHILKGYAWDGMTMYPDKDENKDDSITHDFHYQTGLIKRRHADKILANMARSHDAFHWGIYIGVRIGGWKLFARDKEIKIIRENQSNDHDLKDDQTY
jgi:hypothetical protein